MCVCACVCERERDRERERKRQTDGQTEAETMSDRVGTSGVAGGEVGHVLVVDDLLDVVDGLHHLRVHQGFAHGPLLGAR